MVFTIGFPFERQTQKELEHNPSLLNLSSLCKAWNWRLLIVQ